MRPKIQPIDAITLFHLSREWQDLLFGSKISRIQQHHFYDLLLTFYHPYQGQQAFYIDIAADTAFACIVKKQQLPQNLKAPKTPTNFCVQLRKFLLGAKVTQIKTQADERVIELHLEGINDIAEPTQYCLIIELMGRYSNIILQQVDLNLILAVAHGVSLEQSKARQLRIGDAYLPVPLQKDKIPFSKLTPDQFETLKTQAQQQNTALLDVLKNKVGGIGSQFLQHFCAEIEANPQNFMKIHDQFLGQQPQYFWNKTTNTFGINPHNTEPIESVNPLIAQYYCNQLNEKFLGQKRQQLTRILQQQIERLTEKCTALEELLKADPETLKQQADSALMQKAENQFNNNSDKTNENPSALYAKYKRNKARYQQSQTELEQFSQRKYYAQELLTKTELANTLETLEGITEDCKALGWLKDKESKKTTGKIKSNKRPVSSTSKKALQQFNLKNNYLLWVGQSALQNETLLRQVAKPEDWWLHVQGTQGGHVLLRSPNRQNTVEKDMPSIKQAAAIAVYFSKLRDEKNIPVIYTRAKYVRMVPAAALPGYMQYDEETQLFVDTAQNALAAIETPETETVNGIEW